MKERVIKLLLCVAVLLIILGNLKNHDLRELYKLHYTNKLVVKNVKTKKEFVIENEKLSGYIKHFYSNEKDIADNIDNWEKVYEISFYDSDKFIMNGSILRQKKSFMVQTEKYDNTEKSDVDAEYNYKYSVKVKKLIFFNKTYYSNVEDKLITLLLEHTIS
jgi:hypothetical protein